MTKPLLSAPSKLSILGAGFLFFLSCEKENDLANLSDNKYVNKWMFEEVMQPYYLWNDKIPASLDDEADPDLFFDAMLYKYDKTYAPDGDRFSWIQEDYIALLESLSGVVSNELGFDYKWYGYNQNEVFGEFAYIKKNTDAAAKGLKRGQAFTHVNDTKITMDNYRSLLSGATQGAAVTLTVLDVELDHTSGTIYFENERKISINLLSRYAENPIFLDSIYTVNGKTIGYLVYNFFAADSGDDTGAYDLALNAVFEKFKNRGVENLVLDLRYNSGGSVTSAIYLSSMIVKNLNTSNVFCKMEYNKDYQSYVVGKYGTDYLLDYFTDNIEVRGADGKLTGTYNLHNIGNLQTLYVLTGSWTASASELIINGLIPYMNLFLVGDVTIGKNVGSTTFYKENDARNKWGLQPIIAKFYNSQGKSDYTAGFIPDMKDEDTWNMPKKQLGDINEALLGAAIRHITGEIGASAVTTRSIPLNPALFRVLGSSLDNKPWSNQIVIPPHR